MVGVGHQMAAEFMARLAADQSWRDSVAASMVAAAAPVRPAAPAGKIVTVRNERARSATTPTGPESPSMSLASSRNTS